MAAYAVALHQHDPERAVTATLSFTELDQPYRFELSAAELAALEEDLVAIIYDAMSALSWDSRSLLVVVLVSR